MESFHRRYEISNVFRAAFLVLGCCLLIACSSSRYYIQPASEKQDQKQLAILELPTLHKMAIDNMPVTDFDLVYMVPGWHHFSFGWPQNKGCKKEQRIKYYYRGPGTMRIPKSPYPYDQVRCLEYRFQYVDFYGWWEFSAGDRMSWRDIVNKLKTTQRSRDEVDDLVDRYHGGDLKVRRKAIERLGEIQNLRSIYALLDALKDEKDIVKIEACRSLKKLDNQYAVPYIKKLLHEQKDESVKRAASEALKSLKGY